MAKTAQFVAQKTIDIPRIMVLPKDGQEAGGHFAPFSLDLRNVNLAVPSDDLYAKVLRTGEAQQLGLKLGSSVDEARAENYIVRELIVFDDVSYDDNAALLYDLAAQVVTHLTAYLAQDDARKVLRVHGKEIARLVYAQMRSHFVEKEVGYEVRVHQGLTVLKSSAFTAVAGEEVRSLHQAPSAGRDITRHVYGHFSRCLSDVTKFQSDPERKLAIVLERESEKWFRPALRQFQITYKMGHEHRLSQPDFVAETAETIDMLEPKRHTEMESDEVIAKRDAAALWCRRASHHNATHGGKPWRYVLIPHDAIAENMSLHSLTTAFAVE